MQSSALHDDEQTEVPSGLGGKEAATVAENTQAESGILPGLPPLLLAQLSSLDLISSLIRLVSSSPSLPYGRQKQTYRCRLRGKIVKKIFFQFSFKSVNPVNSQGTGTETSGSCSMGEAKN